MVLPCATTEYYSGAISTHSAACSWPGLKLHTVFCIMELHIYCYLAWESKQVATNSVEFDHFFLHFDIVQTVLFLLCLICIYLLTVNILGVLGLDFGWE